MCREYAKAVMQHTGYGFNPVILCHGAEIGDYSQFDPRCVFMPQLLIYEDSTAFRPLYDDGISFQNHIAMLNTEPANVVIPVQL